MKNYIRKEYMKIIAIVAASFLAMIFVSGCEEKTPAEKMGDTVEDIGETIQEASNDAQRELEDATD